MVDLEERVPVAVTQLCNHADVLRKSSFARSEKNKKQIKAIQENVEEYAKTKKRVHLHEAYKIWLEMNDLERFEQSKDFGMIEYYLTSLILHSHPIFKHEFL